MNAPLRPEAKKAYEVAYAAFRVASVSLSRDLAALFEKESTALLEAVIKEDASAGRATARNLSYFVSFARDTGKIHHDNAELLLRQISELNGLIESSVSSGPAMIDIGGIFSEPESFGAAPTTRQPVKVQRQATENFQAAVNQSKGFVDRQEVILKRIRQSGNCRTSELQAILPELSERTLRYDLQRLVENGKIERGGAGPASWYRIKEDAAFGSNVSNGPTL